MDSWISLYLIAMAIGLCYCQTQSNTLKYCSFFNNRAPETEPNLKNCTWFKEYSCCRQAEISGTFGRVKPLRGASPSCQRYTNYLMCYICSPDQYLFYFRERLTVCEEFCDAWHDACKSAISKGSIIEDLFSSGKEYCLSQRFKVDKHANGRCFNFDAKLDTGGAISNLKTAETFYILIGSFILHFWFKFIRT